MTRALPVADCLPVDHDAALLIGRAWKPGANGGPCVVAVRGAQKATCSCSAARSSRVPLPPTRAVATSPTSFTS